MKINKFLLVFLYAILVTVSACSNLNLDQNSSNKEVYEPITLTTYFCPKHDCDNVLEENVKNAKLSLYCAFYDLNLKNLINEIVTKSKKIDVKVVIDKNNYDEQIKGPGIKVANSKQYMHNKFCIIDNKRIITGSTNPTKNGVNFNNNNLIVADSKYLAENYKEEFDELWNGIYVSGNKVKYKKIISDNVILENYFCPEDDCKGKVIEQIKKAQESVYFMTFSFTDEDIADVILFKNLEIKGIFETTQAGSSYSQYQRLKDFGIDVKKDKNKKAMHHKVFIIDKKVVITGSYNPTGSGNFRNDENILVIHNTDIARAFLNEFDSLWI
ncbi:hypothetical protein ISS07_01290 [Candidatus Woesearchaeota archaeon]|nr:hypothetical protein [Candidatus Woesearchaeota archaeon]